MKIFFRIQINNFHLEKFFNFLTIILFLLCLSFIFLNINKGIDFTDESYSLLRSLHPNLEIGKITYFGYLNYLFLNLFQYNLGFLKIFSILLLLFSFINLSLVFNTFLKQFFKKNFNLILLFVLSFSGIINFYYNWRLSPNYDYYNLLGVTNFLSGLLLLYIKNKYNNNLSSSNIVILISLGLFISLVAKPSTFFILVLLTLICCFFLKEKFSFLKTGILSVLFSCLFFFIFLKIINITFDEYISDLVFGSKIKKIQDPRYDVSFLIFGSLKQIIYFFYTKFYIYISLIPIFYLEKKFFKSNNYLFLIFFFIIFLIYKSPFLATSCFGLYLAIIRFQLLKKNFFEILFLPFIFLTCYIAISIGTNSNFVLHLKKSDIYIFLIFFYFLNFLKFELKFKYFFLNILPIILISTFVVSQFIYGIQNPFRLRSSILNQNNKIYIKPFTNPIYIDNQSYEFIFNVQNIFLDNNWKYNERLIELSGRYPIFNIILSAKYVSKPWYLGGYEGSEDFVKSFLKETMISEIKSAWIITSDYRRGISTKVLKELNINLNEDYIYVNKFQDAKSKVVFKVYRPK